MATKTAIGVRFASVERYEPLLDQLVQRVEDTKPMIEKLVERIEDSNASVKELTQHALADIRNARADNTKVKDENKKVTMKNEEVAGDDGKDDGGAEDASGFRALVAGARECSACQSPKQYWTT